MGHVPAALILGKRPSTHCVGGWVGPRAILDLCRKSRPQWDSIPGLCSPYWVTIPTTIPGPMVNTIYTMKSSIIINITITCKDVMLRAAWTDGTRWGAKNESTLIQAAKAREETKTLPASCCSSSSPDCRESWTRQVQETT